MKFQSSETRHLMNTVTINRSVWQPK